MVLNWWLRFLLELLEIVDFRAEFPQFFVFLRSGMINYMMQTDDMLRENIKCCCYYCDVVT